VVKALGNPQSSQKESPPPVGLDSALATQAERYGQLIHLISHDLRNPLTAVQLNAQLIERGASRAGREQDQRWAALVISAARRLDGMLQQLAETERIRSGRTKLALTRLVFNLFLPQLLAGTGLELEATQIHVTLPQASLAVSADEVRLGQALSNLLRLALQQTAPAAAVMIEVLGNDQEVSCVIRVPNVPEATANDGRPREATTAARAGQCDGIALHVARTLIECHGGTLKVEDRADAALVFEIALPAVGE
jgi:K+-sensing histidine kinase KdpD